MSNKTQTIKPKSDASSDEQNFIIICEGCYTLFHTSKTADCPHCMLILGRFPVGATDEYKRRFRYEYLPKMHIVHKGTARKTVAMCGESTKDPNHSRSDPVYISWCTRNPNHARSVNKRVCKLCVKLWKEIHPDE